MNKELVLKVAKFFGIAVVGIVVIFVIFLAVVWMKRFDMGMNMGMNTYEQGYPASRYEESSLQKSISPMMSALPEDAVSNEASPSEVYEGGEVMSVSQQRLIKEGYLSVRVKDADKAVEEIRGVVEYHKGALFGVQITRNSQGIKSGTVTVKVPVSAFEGAMVGLKEKASVVLNENITAQDATDQYVDLQARLKNKQAEELAFQKILDQVDDSDGIIKVTRELSRVRGEIERLDAQVRNIEAKTDMSTITISLSEDQEVTFVDTWRPWQEVKNRVNELLDSLRSLGSFLIAFVFWFFPLLIVWVLIGGGIYVLTRSVYQKVIRKNKK